MWRTLLSQFRSPLVILLLVALVLSVAMGERADSLIVASVLLLSTLLGFWQEYRAGNAVEALLGLVDAKAAALRDDRETEVPLAEIVPGDVVVLRAGDSIPGDGLILESKDLFVDESALTGESFPAEKSAGVLEADLPQGRRTNAVFEGTHVVSGTARVLVMVTGEDTELGRLSGHLRLREPETEFERGLRRFGELLMRVTFLLILGIFAVNVLLQRPALGSFMFALALAVGMTPELLPAVVSITLAQGARRMAREQVIVRRLHSIENFGSMDVLCSDKTGTLTEGRMSLVGAYDASGRPDALVRLHAVLNATFETGFTNPIDEALRLSGNVDLSCWRKIDEVPYDFVRKRLSVVVENLSTSTREPGHLMVTKGAFSNVLDVCTKVATPGGEVSLPAMLEDLRRRFKKFSEEGHRVLGVAFRDVDGDPLITKDDEADMTFSGFLVFEDPPKPGACHAIQELGTLGVHLKVITGDNLFVARRIGTQMGLADARVLTGTELRGMSDSALVHAAERVDIFAEMEPNQKERILIALRKAGHVVGYLGDGINDASALHAADVGISVDGAADAAKAAADIVLLRRDLGVLAQGVRNGRVTFANTLKYVFITTSANFGNMVSMAGASVFLPFLPLVPKQILLNNLLSDLPALGIAADAVDPEEIRQPRRWDNLVIRRFMVAFGLLGSAFDFLTFGLLLLVLRTAEPEFQTGWFIESLMTELFIALIIRTRRPSFQSRPGRMLFWTTLAVAGTALVLPWTGLGGMFGLVPLPLSFMAALLGVSGAYLLASEALKHWFFAQVGAQSPPAMARSSR